MGVGDTRRIFIPLDGVVSLDHELRPALFDGAGLAAIGAAGAGRDAQATKAKGE